MRISTTFKKNSLILFQIVLMFAIPFATSFLLDIPVIAKNIVRVILICLLLVVQLILMAFVVINTIKNS